MWRREGKSETCGRRLRVWEENSQENELVGKIDKAETRGDGWVRFIWGESEKKMIILKVFSFGEGLVERTQWRINEKAAQVLM